EGGFSDWQRATERSSDAIAAMPDDAPAVKPAASAKKLSFKERKELDELPATMERLEAEQAELHAAMAEPGFYQQPPEQIAAATARDAALTEQVQAAYDRWESLEERAAN
ncbi:MAG: ABC transporter ATP-binding protein, partial [Planctomycetota bacterium]